ncbi:hypothetical protein [Kitasatospora sp. MAP5-34]|uniref:hypothetical protein n=1 Tax=Kitasatospora sp. MAP5-34 TaxID=3035102 RepID=UPI0024755D30|nr:hypothetical protein [Kitasatospora sp. MAP5-34]MDH6578120.1 hypothetical protein [Kitasatospora sp. MAP5-34]
MSSGDNTGERNPFAPPPADAPDQPWQPRLPQQPPADGPADDERPQVPPPWSPGHQGGGWSGPQQPAPQPKFDPNDPVQRRARYALSAGMAGLFCVVTGIPYVALLLGALALYWGVSALRAPRTTEDGATPAPNVRPQTPAAIGGLVTGAVAVFFVLGFLGMNAYYGDYVSCVNDAPTAEAQQGCSHLGPKFLVDLYSSAGQ